MKNMNAYFQEMQVPDGKNASKTVRIITGFGKRAIDPQATIAAVSELINKTPEFLKIKDEEAKIAAQRKIAAEEFDMASAAQAAGDMKNAALHNSLYQSALLAVKAVETEMRPLVDDYRPAWDRLYMENPKYLPCGPGQILLEDGEHETLKTKCGNLKDHELLADTGEVIPDWRGAEYWLKTAGRWESGKIEGIGKTPPVNSVLSTNLAANQREEIAAQQEEERTAIMSGAEKAAAKQAALDALADEADRLDRRARIQRTAFDPAAWYGEYAAEIEAKYA